MHALSEYLSKSHNFINLVLVTSSLQDSTLYKTYRGQGYHGTHLAASFLAISSIMPIPPPIALPPRLAELALSVLGPGPSLSTCKLIGVRPNKVIKQLFMAPSSSFLKSPFCNLFEKTLARLKKFGCQSFHFL